MVRRKISAVAAEPSLAVTSISKKPLKLSGGVPVKPRVAALKLSHGGNALPPDKRAEYVIASPSTSVNADAGRKMFTATSSAPLTSTSGWLKVGASLTGVNVIRKISDADNRPSFANTSRSMKPLKLAGGVPVKRPFAKLNQLGRALPLARRALSVKASPSTSAKLDAGITMSITLSSGRTTSARV